MGGDSIRPQICRLCFYLMLLYFNGNREIANEAWGRSGSWFGRSKNLCCPRVEYLTTPYPIIVRIILHGLLVY